MIEKIKNNRFFKFFASLAFALSMLTLFVISMIYGTMMESQFGSEYASRAIYHSVWFYAIQGLLLVSVLFAAINRLPFKKKLLGFYLIHFSIICLMIGLGVTKYWGIDGKIELAPDTRTSTIILNEDVLVISDGVGEQVIDLPLTVKTREMNHWIDFGNGRKLKIKKYFPYARKVVDWQKKEGMWLSTWQISQGEWSQKFDLTNMAFDNYPSQVFLGPIRISYLSLSELDLLEASYQKEKYLKSEQPTVYIARSEDRGIRLAFGKGDNWSFQNYLPGKVILPWMNLEISLLDEIIDYFPVAQYSEGGPQKDQIPLRALLISYQSGNGEVGSEKWITNSLAESFNAFGMNFSAIVTKKRIAMPISLVLDTFKMEQNPGTMEAASYESFVRVGELGKAEHIYMNNPLKILGYTFYQAEYYLGPDGKYRSILSVNKDPGRPIKYLSAIILVLGIILYYRAKLLTKKNSNEDLT